MATVSLWSNSLWDLVREMTKSNLMYFVNVFYFGVIAHTPKFHKCESQIQFNQNLNYLKKQSDSNIISHDSIYISPWQTVSIGFAYLCCSYLSEQIMLIFQSYILLSIIKPGVRVRSLRSGYVTQLTCNFKGQIKG